MTAIESRGWRGNSSRTVSGRQVGGRFPKLSTSCFVIYDGTLAKATVEMQGSRLMHDGLVRRGQIVGGVVVIIMASLTLLHWDPRRRRGPEAGG